EPRRTRLITPTESNDPCLCGGQLKSELFQTKSQRLIKPLGVLLVLKPAHEIIRVSDQARLALAMFLHDVLEPQIQRVVQVHVCQQRDLLNVSGLSALRRDAAKELEVGKDHSGAQTTAHITGRSQPRGSFAVSRARGT